MLRVIRVLEFNSLLGLVYFSGNIGLVYRTLQIISVLILEFYIVESRIRSCYSGIHSKVYSNYLIKLGVHSRGFNLVYLIYSLSPCGWSIPRVYICRGVIVKSCFGIQLESFIYPRYLDSIIASLILNCVSLFILDSSKSTGSSHVIYKLSL